MTAPKYRRNTEYFEYTNPNPKGWKSSGDCVIRALSIATGKSWETVYTELCNIGFEIKQMPNDDRVYEQWLENNGWIKQKQPRKENNKKYTAKEMSYMSGEGVGITAVIRLANHLSVIKNGKIYDTWNCGENTVGNFWIL